MSLVLGNRFRVTIGNFLGFFFGRNTKLGFVGNRGFYSCSCSSGLLTVDRLLLSIDAILNFSGFIGAEDVGAAGFDLLDSSDDISLDHVLVDLDLRPLFDSFFCGINIQLFSVNQVLTSVDRIDKVSELNRIVCNNIAGCNLVGRFVI